MTEEVKKEYSIKDKLQYKLPYKWKIQSFNKDKTKASCVAYIDARDVADLLDRAIGVENWKDEYKFEGNQWLCGISLKFNDEWVTKWDTGIAGDIEKEKSVVSDAFKRAAVKWGVGRFLYDLEIKWVNYDPQKRRPIDEAGKVIYNLTEYLSLPKYGKFEK